MAEPTPILILDDDAVFLDVIARSLQKRQYFPLPADTVAAALQLTRQHKPTLAVVDLKIARESGLDALPALLALQPAMRILMLTGYSSIATAVTAIKTGAFDYACKPLDTDEILHTLLPEQHQSPPITDRPSPLSVDRLEWEHIQRILAENDGNISATARSLGMHRRTLQRKLQKRHVRQ